MPGAAARLDLEPWLDQSDFLTRGKQRQALIAMALDTIRMTINICITLLKS